MPAHNFINLVGQKFGRLTVVSRGENTVQGVAQWNCICECGGTAFARTASLRNGNTQSCGCLHRETSARNARKSLTTHGMRHTAEYRIWRGVKDRCLNPNIKDFPNYGGRGITLCDAWNNSFEEFFNDMGPRPSPAHSIDRIDNNGPYSPQNCRWAVAEVQHSNTRANRHISFQGETKTLTQWARITGIAKDTLHYRLKAGWSIERALTEPIRHLSQKPSKET